MPSDTASYLASHYLVADPKPSSSGKKRKRSGKTQQQQDTGLIIADDDATGWGNNGGGDDDNNDTDMIGGGGGFGFGGSGLAGATVAGTSAEFRKAKKSAWKSLSGTTTAPPPTDSTEADAIVASAAQEATSNNNTNENDEDSPAVMMSDGTYAGLQSAASVTAQLEKRKAKERAEFDKLRRTHKEAETVYRDATGRRVDVEWKRAEARREAAAAKDKEAAAQQALRGEVQEEERRMRRERLDDAKLMGVARHADDEEMNQEMKEKTRWGDTMAQFIEPKAATAGGGGAGKSGGGKRVVKGKPIYQGAWTPNRYGIRPGYRWDGVDRSNGFEAERFKAINRKERNKGLEYSWQMDE